MSYARVGRGEPLVLLHGIGHHRQAWDPVVDILATEREVIAVDLPGFGASPGLPDGLAYDLPTTNSVLGALFEALGWTARTSPATRWASLLALELGREEARTVRHRPVPRGFLDRGRAAVRVHGAARDAGRRPALPLPLVSGCPVRRPAVPR